MKKRSISRLFTISVLIIISTLIYNVYPVVSLEQDSEPQGYSPFGITITTDGNYAYICHDLSEFIFKISLENLAIESVADLSEYFPAEFELIQLDASEEKLFVYSPSWQKLLVLDTQTMSIIHMIANITIIGMIQSHYGPSLITWDGGTTVRLVNTETYEVTKFTDNQMFFVRIQESRYNPSIWYVANSTMGYHYACIYNYTSKEVIFSKLIPTMYEQSVFDLEVLPNEQKMYIATLGGWYSSGYHSYGWLHTVNITDGEVRSSYIDGGALCLEAIFDSQWLYIGTGWPIPTTNNLLVLNTHSDNITNQIYLGQNKFGWPYTQMNDLKINPANHSVMYATSTDGNAFIKVDLDNLSLINSFVLNRERLQPSNFVKRPMQTTGYVIVQQTYTYELDLITANITEVIKLPQIRDDAYPASLAFNDAGRMFIPQGEAIYEINSENMNLLGIHQLPPDMPAVWNLILSNDQTMFYLISQDRNTTGYYPDTFLAINATTFKVEASLKLTGGRFCERPFTLPNSSKIYILGGQHNGPVVIHVIETDTYNIIKTMTFNESDSLGIAIGDNYPFVYDNTSHTLFVGATHVILAVDTHTDTIKDVIYLKNISPAIGLKSGYLTHLNAIGLVYHPVENYLYIAHLDRSFISIYDLNTSEFLPLVISLKGFFPYFVMANDDYSYIYSINHRSDSISVIDVTSKTVEKVIYLGEIEIPEDDNGNDNIINGYPFISIVGVVVIGIFWRKLRSKKYIIKPGN